ncbi:KA1 domain/Ssp2 C-terminal domain-containing protein, partial [Paraphysoderma sedebokerense]
LNVSTTSSKLPSDIITEVCRVLKENEVSYMYDGGYVIECTANEGKGNEDSTKGSVVFEIEICKVPRLNLFGLHFKRLNGSIWNYKKVCNKLLAQMNL